MKAKIIHLCLLLLIIGSVHAAPLRNVPMLLTQPDSTQVTCFASGDEFYHWLHDSLGNIITKDSVSKFYCYKVKDFDSLVVVGSHSDSRLQYSKNPYEFPNKLESNIEMYNREEQHPYRFTPSRSGSPRVINNIVIFITFADDTVDFNSSERLVISMKFNDSTTNANSLKQYFWESSYHQLKVNSSFYPSGSSMYSYKDSHPRGFYCKLSNIHPNGYDSDDDDERIRREHTLLKNAVNSVISQIPSSLNVDTDNDNYVDNVCFVVKGEPEGWNDILWPHHWVLLENVSINGKIVADYNFHMSNYLLPPPPFNVGTLCHEFGHTLGLPDLYHYYPDPNTNVKWKPVGIWDLMASHDYKPQQTSGYMKWKKLHWINSIPEITQCGHYTLSPISSTSQCYKINVSGSGNEFLYLEYRDKANTYDQSIPHSGLLAYRINPAIDGNSSGVLCGGKQDEVYVYRPNGNLSSDGDLSDAPFCAELEATEFNESTNPQEFLSNGHLGNVYIYNISECGSVISFDLRFRTYENVVYNQNSTIPSVTNAETITTTGNVVINNNTTFKATEGIFLNAGFEVSNSTSFTADVNPCE